MSNEKQRKTNVQKRLPEMMITFGIMLATAAIVYILKVPNPNVFLLTGIAVFTSLYGYPAGTVSAVVTVGYSLFYFSTDHSLIHFTGENLQKMAVILLGAMLNLWLIGHLKKRNSEVLEKLEEVNEILKLDNLALEEATITDSLTEVKNRFAFRKDYSSFEGQELHVMMIDIDDFKSINDSYGHSAGDYMLTRLGGALLEVFGKEYCYRYGGDEFLIVTPDLGEGVFQDCIRCLMAMLKDFNFEGTKIEGRFSAGYVYGRSERSDDLRYMLRQADSKLYEIKNSGKNKFNGCKYSRAEAEKIERDPNKSKRGG